MTWGNLLVLHTPEDELIAYGPDRTERWRVTDVPRPLNTQTTLRMMSVMSIRGALTLVGLDGTIIGRETLDDTGDLAPAPDGGFTLRSGADLWHIDAAGNRQRLAGSPPVQRGSSALQSSIDGQFFLYSGDRDHTLYGYSADGQARWAIALDDLQGRPTMLAERGVVLLADRFGTVVAVSAERGTVCNWLNVWGNRAAEAQVNVGIDTVLRLHVADHIIGLDWNILTSGCR